MFFYLNFCINVNNVFWDCYDSLNDVNFVIFIILMVFNIGIFF